MKKHINKVTATLVLTLAALALGACSMPESHKSDMQTHEMGTPGKTHSMGNSVMKPTN